jgi:hypothetical protein
VWSSFDRGSYLIYEPAGVKNISLYLPGVQLENYDYIHPAVLYFVTTSGDGKMYVAGIWYMRNIDSIDDIKPNTVLYHPYLPNVFRDGMVCTHNFYSHNFDPTGSVNLNINMAIEDFWSSNFNDEVNDFIGNLETVMLFNHFYPEKHPATGEAYTDFSMEHSQAIFFKHLSIMLDKLRNGYWGKDWETNINDLFNTILPNQYHGYNVQGIMDLIVRNNPQTALFEGTSYNSDIMNHYLLNDILRLTYQNQF